MKNLAFLFLLLLAFGCGSSCDEASLKNAYDEVDVRGDEYFADLNNKAKCNAYVGALEDCIDQMKNCDVDPTEIESYQNTLDAQKEECK